MTTKHVNFSLRSLQAGILVTGLSFASVAGAQGLSFGEDEVEAVGEMSASGKIIEEGKALYNDNKFEEASLLFWKVVQDGDVSAEAFKPEAQYELGKTLFKMGLYQSSLQMFGAIVDSGESNPYFLPTLRGLVLLTDDVPEDPILMQRLAAYRGYFPNEVPERYRDRFAYLVGRHLYNELDLEDALTMLNTVTTRSEDYAKARYIAGVTYVANYEAQPAVAAFKEVLRFLTAKQSSGKLNAAEQSLLDMTHLAMARVFYSTGSYNTSLKYYGLVPRTSRDWPTALFESSWAYFQMDLYNKALGNLLTINAPFFDEAYFPEGTILTAVLYFYNCRYDRVRYVLQGFDDQFAPIKSEIDTVVARYANDSEAMYKWMIDQRQGATENYELLRVVNSALRDQQVQRKLKLIEAIEEERVNIRKKADKWKSSSLASSLETELSVSAGFARSDAGMIAQQRLERASRELENLVLEEKKIMFEVARAEKGEIEADLRAAMVVDKDVTKRPKIEVSDEELYWTFDGEYWRDELGYYVFDVNSECKR